MDPQIPEEMLAQLSEVVGAKIGLHFPPSRWSDLERGIASAMPDLGCEKLEDCIKWLLSSQLTKRQVETLASHLTIGETYFFREKHALGVLKEKILPSLVSSRQHERRIRIWSAGCCSGEEPYTIAIVITQILPDWKQWNLTILGTDINPLFLQKAAAGIYSEWSFRQTPSWVKQNCFRKIDRRHYQILPHFKAMVDFNYLNLAEDVYPSLQNNTNAMDIILCRNVLMYFSDAQKARVIEHFYNSLVEGGWLIVSASETSPWIYHRFSSVNHSGTTFYQKRRPASSYPEDQHSPGKVEDDLAAPPLIPQNQHQPLPPAEQSEKIQDLYSDALVCHSAGDYAGAIALLSKLVSENFENADAISLLARAHANKGDLEEALKWCDKAIYFHKLNPALYYLRATILQEQGSHEICATTLRRVLYLDSGFVLAHFALGNVAAQMGHREEAQKHFANALSLIERQPPEVVLPGSEGITAGRLREIIRATIAAGGAA